MTVLAVLGIGLLLVYANGANDNYKGVATLLGSGTASYRRALLWATVTTALGSLTALVLARGLLAAFAGKGLVRAEVVADPIFPTAVALSAGLTVLLGGLGWAGLVASPVGINTATLATGFLLPLLTSPVVSSPCRVGYILRRGPADGGWALLARRVSVSVRPSSVSSRAHLATPSRSRR